MNISLVVPSSDMATDTMTDFEKVDRVRRSSADTCLFWLPSGAYTRSFWIGIFYIGNFCFWVPFLKQLLLRNCAVDFVEICNVYIGKMIIKAAKRIFNSGKIYRSYSDLNFGVTFLEHSVVFSSLWTPCCKIKLNGICIYFCGDPRFCSSVHLVRSSGVMACIPKISCSSEHHDI